MRVFARRIVVGMTLCVMCSGVLAQTPVANEEYKLTASDADTSDYYGVSVAASDDIVVVGSWGDDHDNSYAGSAYIYRLVGGNWQETKIFSNDIDGNAYFGHSVSISGNTVVVGAPEDDTNGNAAGSAFVYRLNGTSWIEYKLLPSEVENSDRFGYSVAISGETVVVGSYNDDENGSNSGSAYVFRFNGSSWVQEQKLLASDGQSGDEFGNSVTVDGNTIVVGAFRHDGNVYMSGSAYVYNYIGKSWVQVQELLANDAQDTDKFGNSVSIHDDILVVGAYRDDDNGNMAGSAYVYRLNGTKWVQEQKLKASDGESSDEFGISVSTFGGTVVIGAYGNDDDGTNSGSAYVYRFDGTNWVETKLLASDAEYADEFGISVGVYGDLAIVGAYADDTSGLSNTGSAYIFNIADSDYDGIFNSTDNCYLYNPDQLDCNVNGIGDVCDIANGKSSDVNYNDIPDECEPDCNDNDVPDSWDIKTGSSEDCNGNEVPDECDIANGTSTDLNNNNIPDDCDPDCNQNGYPDDWELKKGLAQDCNLNGILDDCDIADGTSEDTNSDGVPDECELDCNENGLPDFLDIKWGISEDCNANAVPDECDIADQVSMDCDQNGVPDECQPDCDGDGWIDACDSEGDCDNDGVPDNCELDCNENQIPDDCDIIFGISEDINGDGIPDDCQCLSDANGDGEVNVNDLLAIVGYWGSTGPLGDVNYDGIVNVGDLLKVIDDWGPCE